MKRTELKDFLSYKFMSEAELAPGGQRAAFAVHSCDEEGNGYKSNIHVYDFAAKKSVQLTAGGKESSFLWLDAERLIFPSDRDEGLKGKLEEGERWTVYYAINVGGGEAREYMRIPLSVSSLKVLSLEDETFLVTGTHEIGGEDINSLSGEERQKATKAHKENQDYEVLEEIPFWANGGGFTNKKRSRLYIYNRKAGKLTPVSDETAYSDHAAYKDGCVVYAANPFKDKLELYDQLRIYHLSDGKTYTLIGNKELAIWFCDFTEDGRHIVIYGTDMKSYGENQDGCFYMLDLADDKRAASAPRAISASVAVGNSVGSDCRYGGGRSVRLVGDVLYFTSTVWRSARLYALDLRGFPAGGAGDAEGTGDAGDAGGAEDAGGAGGAGDAGDGKNAAPAHRFLQLTADNGSVDCFDVCGGKAVYVAMRDQKLQEVYASDVGKVITDNAGGAPSTYLAPGFQSSRAASLDTSAFTENRLTDFNEAALEGKYVAVPELLTFENGGTALEGWVLRPYGYDESLKAGYPAILDIHGGPKTVYGTVHYHEMQLWASKGCFVFFCNPRGGDGRGDEFADIRGKYGTIDYEDLMKFTDLVLEKYPQIDASRVGVTGGSYGGFMTNWIIGHTDRFACAASQRSISNWISKFCTTDIGYFFVHDQVAATPWSDVDKMWEHSPLKYADRCKTPTLFIHSEQDYRCWLAEGLQMFTALKYHGVEARLCMFKGENHELSRGGKPRHRVRRLTEMTDWFERFLK